MTVRVHAVALGPWDVATTEGLFAAAGGTTTFPQILGWDFAGTIAAAGALVPQWKPGDRVLGFSPQPWSGIGAAAELIAVPPDLIAALPAGLDFSVGATIPVTALTAQSTLDTGEGRSLYERARDRRGWRGRPSGRPARHPARRADHRVCRSR